MVEHFEHFQGPLKEACLYALMNGGRRVRPIICLLIAESLGSLENAIAGAIAIEFFHTASLVADDLPCMDDDDERRGHPSTHKRFGEAVAILTTYALIAEGYGRLGFSKSEHLSKLLEETTLATGLLGASQGQLLDLDGKNSKEMIEKKTGSLFELSFIYGWIFGGGQLEQLHLVRETAAHFGLAFQIYDDLEDLGEEGVNIAENLGVDQALTLFNHHLDSFKALAERLGLSTLLNLTQIFEKTDILPLQTSNF